MVNSKLAKILQNKPGEGKKSHLYLPILLSQKEAREAARSPPAGKTTEMCKILEKEELAKGEQAKQVRQVELTLIPMVRSSLESGTFRR